MEETFLPQFLDFRRPFQRSLLESELFYSMWKQEVFKEALECDYRTHDTVVPGGSIILVILTKW